jgi:hypothetical protein
MALKEELYLSLEPQVYKKNKSNILENQADLLKTLKKLHTLRVLARQKQDLKKQLQKLLPSIKTEIISIQNKLPTSELPKTIKPTREKIKIEQSLSRQDDIEEELKLIQEKLRQLNN